MAEEKKGRKIRPGDSRIGYVDAGPSVGKDSPELKSMALGGDTYQGDENPSDPGNAGKSQGYVDNGPYFAKKKDDAE